MIRTAEYPEVIPDGEGYRLGGSYGVRTPPGDRPGDADLGQNNPETGKGENRGRERRDHLGGGNSSSHRNHFQRQ
jgi:hypothetical protein